MPGVVEDDGLGFRVGLERDGKSGEERRGRDEVAGENTCLMTTNLESRRIRGRSRKQPGNAASVQISSITISPSGATNIMMMIIRVIVIMIKGIVIMMILVILIFN